MYVRRIFMVWAAIFFLILIGTVHADQRAPEIRGARWINGVPQTLESLRGKVVLVDFWTRA